MLNNTTGEDAKTETDNTSPEEGAVTSEDVKRKNHKNPMSPSKTLSDAISMAKQIYDIDGTAPIHRNRVAKMFKLSSTSSTGSAMLSTLGQYGLINYFKNKEAKISELAIQIVGPDKEITRKAIEKAALSPKLFKQLWSVYGDDRLPSAETIAHKLVVSYRFKPFSVALEKAEIFLDACKFAGIGGQRNSVEEEVEQCEDIPDDAEFFSSPQTSIDLKNLTTEDLKQTEFSPPDVGLNSPEDEPVMLENKSNSPNYNKVTLGGKTWELVLPDECTQQDVEKFKQYLSMVVSTERPAQTA